MPYKTCAISGESFFIDDTDLDYYQKLKVPSPTLSPDERTRRRWGWRGKDFYIRNCDCCGASAMSWFSPRLSGIKVYCEDCFRKDSFDARIYSREYDFSRRFFDQYRDLYLLVPKHASNAMQNENCRFIISSHQNKDCYMSDETDFSRDCYFGYTVQRSKNIVEGLYVHDSEIGMGLVKAEKCYNVFFSQNVFNCTDSAFLLNCRGCQRCLYCCNLRRGEYQIFNKQVSKEDFERAWRSIFTGKRQDLEKAQNVFASFVEGQPFPATIMINTEDSTGHYSTNSKDVRDCYFVDNCRDCRYCTDLHFSKDCYDVNVYEGELLYEGAQLGPKGYNNLFCYGVWYSSDVSYCTDCYYIKNCFGCAGLKKEEYCILNKPYRKEHYLELREKIIEQMQRAGEWGEFFPLDLSPQPYNHSMAHRFFPLNEEQAIARGLSWLNEEETEVGEVKREFPDDIADLTEEQLKKVFICSKSGKRFRFTPQEVEFYRQRSLPLPTMCPQNRIESLWQRLGERKLHSRLCGRCGKRTHTNYPSEFAGTVYCNECYTNFAYNR